MLHTSNDCHRFLTELSDVSTGHIRVRLLDSFGNSVPVRQLEELPKMSFSRCRAEGNNKQHCDVTAPDADDNILDLSFAAITVAGDYVLTLDGKQIGDVVTVDVCPP